MAIRDVLRCFVAAVEARDFEAAHALLGRTWRDRVDVARLERDFELEPLAADRVRRLKTQLEAEVSLEGPAATLALGEGASAALALEPEGWRLLRLE